MTRKKPSRRRDWRMTVFLIISLIIVLTMVFGTLLMSLPGPN